MKSGLREICLFLAPTCGYFEDVAMGVAEYARRQSRWVIEICPSLDAAVGTTAKYRPRGVLVASNGSVYSKLMRRLKVPAVELGGEANLGLPVVSTDNHAIGQMGAEHLMDLGFRHFAFCGYRHMSWSLEREAGFRAALKVEPGNYSHYGAGEGEIYVGAVSKSLAKWVKALPKPVAIMACHDRVAMLLAFACNLLRLRVPDEVAILGVDNSLLECGFTNPPLSSIMGSARRVGYESAALLDRLIDGKSPPRKPLLVPPAGVARRQSTDVLAISDPDVLAAMKYIHAHCSEGINVADVAAAVLVSRRMLERKFLRLINRTPGHELLRARVARAKSHLVNGTQQVLQVAIDSGFPSASKLSSVFKRKTGVSPTEYRKLYGVGSVT
jgi:LacI family transcriptional regulator